MDAPGLLLNLLHRAAPARPYQRPPSVDWAEVFRESMIPSLVAIGTVVELGKPPGGWADVEWRAFRQDVVIDVEERLYDPKQVPDRLTASVLVLLDMPFSCKAPCIGSIRPSIIGERVLIEARHENKRQNIEVYAGAESFVADPTPEDIARAMTRVPKE